MIHQLIIRLLLVSCLRNAPHNFTNCAVIFVVLVLSLTGKAYSKYLRDTTLVYSLVLAQNPAKTVNPLIGTGAHGHTFPGATLPFVESHIMEHGLMMLKGQGVYRLDADWHPVQAGDVIWMASYCPQWFVCSGKSPASYIYYKDVNRHPDTL